MARAERTGRRVSEAVTRLQSDPTITPDDLAMIYNVDSNTMYKELNAGRIDVAQHVGSQFRIASAPHRAKLSLVPALAEPVTEAA